MNTTEFCATGHKVTFRYPKSGTGELVNRMGIVESVRITDEGYGILTMWVQGIDYPKSFRIDRIVGNLKDVTLGVAYDAEQLADKIEEVHG